MVILHEVNEFQCALKIAYDLISKYSLKEGLEFRRISELEA